MTGHAPRNIPYAVQSAKPVHVRTYAPAEMSAVRRDLMIFQACGVKLVTEQSAARVPMTADVSIRR